MSRHLISAVAIIAFYLLTACESKNGDPYLWLENIDSTAALDFAREHNQKTEAAFTELELFTEIYSRNLAIYNSDERIAYPRIVGEYIYNFWQDDEHVRGILRRTTLASYLRPEPVWETVIDIDALSAKENKMWVYKGVTWLAPEMRYCMVRLSPGGGDAVEMREFDSQTKEFIGDGFFLPEAKGSVAWRHRDELLISTDFGEGTTTASGYPRSTRAWQRGTPLGEATELYRGDSSDVGVWGSVQYTAERKYEIIYQAKTFYSSNVFIVEAGQPEKLEIPEDAEFEGFIAGQMLIQLKSDWQINEKIYPQGALLSIDYDAFRAGARAFSEIITPDERSSISGITTSKNLLLVNLLRNVRSELYAFRYRDGAWQQTRIQAPEYGNISIVSSDDYSDRFFFTYTSFLQPTTLYLAQSEQRRPQSAKQLPAFFSASDHEVKQYEATSKDGTKIPYFVVQARDIVTDGTNPTLLYGYGGFEVSMKPRYSAVTGTAWLARGGVYVLANIRGGGEFGPQWHQAALKENRQRAYDDFAAVAEDLIARKITSPRHLGISGGSNGGLLVGVAFTQRPDLFNAVVCRVPLLDMKRYNKLLAGASWMGEYGDPDKAEEWAFISKYSPYHNLRKNTAYPTVFFNTSTRDDRVHPGHARKMVAKMEAMGYPVYYYENIEGGHGAASTNEQAAYQAALIYTYLHEQLN
jgi:prolyl oligopeptidase